MTSEGCAPAAAASTSRASSTARRARRPEPCSEEGLPVRASSRVSAASASGARVVVAAWSRYTGTGQFYLRVPAAALVYIRAVKASVYLVLATLFWSGNFVVGQAAVGSMTPLDLTFWRWTLAAVPLLLLAHFVEKPDWRAVLRRWPVLLLLSVLGMSGYTLLLYGALGYTSAMNASLITAANPALIVVMAIVLLGERTTRLGWLGICLGLLGVLLVLTRGELQRVSACPSTPVS